MSETTIAAIATSAFSGGIGIVRISGKEAALIADKVFFSLSGKKVSSLKGYTALFGEIRHEGRRIDEAVALRFVAPKSYTGEDVVELSVHGGKLVLKEVLRAVLENGAVMADAGEFTKRAFLNGKMDLIKAESVMALIGAESLTQLRFASSVHSGSTGKTLSAIEKNLVSAAASIAAYCDYPEEDIGEIDENTFKRELSAVENSLSKMISEYEAGRILREGVNTVIVGSPNVGKSTLMNLIAGATKSIVTDVAGTTRDVIEDYVMLGEVPLLLADTAGIRESDDIVESAGVALAKERLSCAQLVLAVFDASKKPTNEDYMLLEQCKDKPTIVILNKGDKGYNFDDDFAKGMEKVNISAINGDGYDALVSAVARVTLTEQLNPDSALLLSERQRDLAFRARENVREALEALVGGVTPDCIGVLVDSALSALYEMTGERATDTVTEEIFSKFCVGK